MRTILVSGKYHSCDLNAARIVATLDRTFYSPGEGRRMRVARILRGKVCWELEHSPHTGNGIRVGDIIYLPLFVVKTEDELGREIYRGMYRAFKVNDPF